MACHSSLIPQSSWSLPAMLHAGHTSLRTDSLMTGHIFKTELFKLTHVHSILLYFCKVTRNLLFLAFFPLQCFKIHPANPTEAQHSCLGCKSISTPLGYSSEGFLDFNIHWAMYSYSLQPCLGPCTEKGKQQSLLLRGCTRRIFIEELILCPCNTTRHCQAVTNHPLGSSPGHPALQVLFIHWLFPPEHRLNDSQYTTFLQLWKQQNLSNYSQESSSRTQSGACQGWNAEEGSAAMWRGNYPETVGCLYQIYRYNEFWFLWTSLCFPTHGFRAASAQQDPLLTAPLHDRLCGLLCLRYKEMFELMWP